MKKSIQTAMVVVAILFAEMLNINPAIAQDRQQHPPMRTPDSAQIDKMVKELAKEISLTEEQQTQVTELYFAHFNKAKAKMQKSEAKHEKLEKRREENRKDFENQVGELLNEDQKAKFKEFMKDQRPERQRGQRSGGNENRR
jgi:Spy/CpxP family protein refolding chaperone